MLDAWLERHGPEIRAIGGRAKLLVRRRLRTLVADTAGMFPDIDPLVHHGGKSSKIKWRAEPASPTGNGVSQFELLLGRIGPLAIAITSSAAPDGGASGGVVKRASAGHLLATRPQGETR